MGLGGADVNNKLGLFFEVFFILFMTNPLVALPSLKYSAMLASYFMLGHS